MESSENTEERGDRFQSEMMMFQGRGRMIRESRSGRNRDEQERSRTKNEIDVRNLENKKMNRTRKRMYR
jgi:hypothetical protein